MVTLLLEHKDTLLGNKILQFKEGFTMVVANSHK